MMEKLSKIDAHLLGLKRKLITDKIFEEKKLKLLESKKVEKNPFWVDRPMVLTDILRKSTAKQKKQKYNPMEQREIQKKVPYICLYKNNVQEQLNNVKLRLDNSEDFSIEKERFQCEYNRLLAHHTFIFGDSIHAYNSFPICGP